MKISNLPAAVMWGEFWQQSQFDTVMVGITLSDRRRPGRHQSLATRAQSPAKGGRGSNNAQYSNPEVDSLLDKVLAPSIRKRGARSTIAYKSWFGHDLPFLPLYQTIAVQGTQERDSSVRAVTRNTRTESWNAAAWSWVS